MAVNLFQPAGSNWVDGPVSHQTLTPDSFDTFENHRDPNNTSSFDPLHRLDVVSLCRAGKDPDTLTFNGSDFGDSVDVPLQNTHYAQDGALILDPASGNRVRLTGNTAAQLVRD